MVNNGKKEHIHKPPLIPISIEVAQSELPSYKPSHHHLGSKVVAVLLNFLIPARNLSRLCLLI